MGEKKNDILFGKSMFGGFDRKDVMEYIDTLQRETQAKIQNELQQSETKIAQLEEALQSQKSENARLQEAVTDLQAQLKVAQAENDLLRERDPSPKSIDDVDAMVHRNLD